MMNPMMAFSTINSRFVLNLPPPGVELRNSHLKTEELAVLVALRKESVVSFHTQMAKQTGASRDEVISAILNNESWKILYWVMANSGQIDYPFL